MKDYIEERAVEVACYIIETRATVRQAAKKFGISKSTGAQRLCRTSQNDQSIPGNGSEEGPRCKQAGASYPWGTCYEGKVSAYGEIMLRI